jgi:hypothetical protein
MASADLYGACISFLVGDSGDVRAAVNAEQPALLGLGSVLETRAIRSKAPRQPNPPPLAVEITLHEEADRVVGVGWSARDLVFDLTTCLRRKDRVGANQAATLNKVTRALLARYRNVSNLALTVTDPVGNLATFVRSDAVLRSPDDDPDSDELARAVVRATFTFLEPDADNT